MNISEEETLQIKKVRAALSSLSIYGNILRSSVVSRLESLLECIGGKDPDVFGAVELYNGIYRVLLDYGCSFRDYVIDHVLMDENPFSRSAENREFNYIEDSMRDSVGNDLYSLQLVAGTAPAVVKKCLSNWCSQYGMCVPAGLPSWDFHSKNRLSEGCSGKVKELLCKSNNWGGCYSELLEFHSQYGYGEFAFHKSFIWEHNGDKGYFRHTDSADPVRLSELIGYEEERSEVIGNTRQLLAGYPANNILLYGDRGTGKSSTVKAILNEYHNQGLRLIEVPKSHLLDFPLIVRHLRNRKHKFIIFVDDLVFEDNEENFTALKAALEGGIESKPQNVAVYATSNRRHLIKESFRERQGLSSGNRDEEVRAADAIQEKLSLSDRFGITVIFSSPDKERYLQIVEGIADSRGLGVDRDTLRREALKWELWYNGRSPRTARQFVDWLEGHPG